MFLRLAGLIALVCAGGVAQQQTLAPADRHANLDSFEQVWKTVRDKHWDLNGKHSVFCGFLGSHPLDLARSWIRRLSPVFGLTVTATVTAFR
jgi:hypothetical protein